jgi:hypothetical protein
VQEDSLVLSEGLGDQSLKYNVPSLKGSLLTKMLSSAFSLNLEVIGDKVMGEINVANVTLLTTFVTGLGFGT